jgi:hypothetical protein
MLFTAISKNGLKQLKHKYLNKFSGCPSSEFTQHQPFIVLRTMKLYPYSVQILKCWE